MPMGQGCAATTRCGTPAWAVTCATSALTKRSSGAPNPVAGQSTPDNDAADGVDTADADVGAPAGSGGGASGSNGPRGAGPAFTPEAAA